MRSKITSLLLTLTVLLLSSCASIVSKSSYPISINSNPSEAKISITDKKGVEVYSGNTPATLKLKAGSGFFGKAQYQVKFEKNGYDSKIVPVHFKLDGWYFGNILLGGVIGMLIVDPATGAMYKLDTEFLNETLSKSTASVGRNGLNVYELSEIPTEWAINLVELKN
ncbi:PEGA domain-containing protein [Psychroflexus lacisalsi]|uniref:PEGA domain-containing protein n=1 Tax=Psychroflexus lacisalsi TaxID=503928 RepID=A0ABP3VK37_9FLAO|nr:PEGA domain-containing protein [Psychroflexus lacisalsi]MBZ9621251.1 PEGA domain-containing protein [Psychroflexus lacisalsi]